MSKKKDPKKAAEEINRFNLDTIKELTEQLSDNPKAQSKSSSNEPNQKGRVKLTTMIDPTLRDKLKIIAVTQNVNFSDVLDNAINYYLNNH